MYFFGRGISAFFNQLFKWLFWNKTGQKILFIIVIFTIAVCFIKLGEVSAVEEVIDTNYQIYQYYEGITNEAISMLGRLYINNPNNGIFNVIKQDTYNNQFYFYYGNIDGSSYANGQPLNKNYLNIIEYSSSLGFTRTPTTSDYMALTGQTLYNFTGQNVRYRRFLVPSSMVASDIITSFYIPLNLYNYKTNNWLEFEDYIRNGNEQKIVELLTTIEEDLSNTTPDQESEDSVVVDSSVAESVDSAAVDNVFSSAFTNFANKFTYYDLSDADQWVINIQGTRIVLRSDIIYNIIKNTWFYPMLQLLWYYIFGHYAFVWLTNLIHKIKDGSILDGMQMNEVISKEML